MLNLGIPPNFDKDIINSLRQSDSLPEIRLSALGSHATTSRPGSSLMWWWSESTGGSRHSRTLDRLKVEWGSEEILQICGKSNK
jgi:hypothetical protein